MSMQQQIEQKLQQAFTPNHLEVLNESHMHRVELAPRVTSK